MYRKFVGLADIKRARHLIRMYRKSPNLCRSTHPCVCVRFAVNGLAYTTKSLLHAMQLFLCSIYLSVLRCALTHTHTHSHKQTLTSTTHLFLLPFTLARSLYLISRLSRARTCARTYFSCLLRHSMTQAPAALFFTILPTPMPCDLFSFYLI